MNKPLASSGFTLIEIMVSLFILMITGLLVSSQLNFIVRSKESVETKAKRLGHLQMAVTTIEEDLHQIRFPAPAVPGKPVLPSFTLSDSFIQFTRSGYYIPGATQIKSLQQVSYLLYGKKLVRSTAPYFNLLSQGIARYQILLDHVRSFHCRMIPARNAFTDSLQPDLQDKIIQTALMIDIGTEDLGHIIRIIPLAINTTDTDPNAAL